MSEPQQVDLNTALQSAVQEAVGQVWEGDMVTRFIAIVETLDGTDGSRALLTASTPGMKAWESLGLLAFATQVEQAEAVADRIGDGE